MSGRAVLCAAGEKDPEEHFDRIIELVNDPFLEWNDRVIGNRNALRADLGTTLGDIAVADSQFILQ